MVWIMVRTMVRAMVKVRVRARDLERKLYTQTIQRVNITAGTFYPILSLFCASELLLFTLTTLTFSMLCCILSKSEAAHCRRIFGCCAQRGTPEPVKEYGRISASPQHETSGEVVAQRTEVGTSMHAAYG